MSVTLRFRFAELQGWTQDNKGATLKFEAESKTNVSIRQESLSNCETFFNIARYTTHHINAAIKAENKVNVKRKYLWAFYLCISSAHVTIYLQLLTILSL